MKLRKYIRLKNYNYRSNGHYFVTICSADKIRFLNEYREIIEATLTETEQRYIGIRTDYYYLMDDHLHIIFILENSSVSLSQVIGSFKSLTTLKAKKAGFKGKRFWQPNYYEHIIRNESALQKIREYIENNPLAEELKWEEIDKNGRASPAATIHKMAR
jgi:REP element-mobilizing transposase RayT